MQESHPGQGSLVERSVSFNHGKYAHGTCAAGCEMSAMIARGEVKAVSFFFLAEANFASRGWNSSSGACLVVLLAPPVLIL